jgi:hypothetical protein
MFNDPSGEELITLSAIAIGALIGAAIGVATYTIGLIINDKLDQFNVGHALKSAFYGAISGAVTAGIGDIFRAGASVAKALGDATFLVQAAAHGVAQGAMSAMQGGDFWQGAAAGFFGSFGASAWQGIGKVFAKSAVGTIAFGALSGGVGASLADGNFWQGAVTGGIVAGLNHEFHKGQQKSKLVQKLRKAGYNNPHAKADISQNQLIDFAEDVFPSLMELADNPSFKYVDSIEGGASGRTRGTTKNGVTRVLHSIEITSNSKDSYFELASVMGHELNHAYHINSGLYDQWYNKYGEIKATAMTEYASYLWMVKIGGMQNNDELNENLNIIKNK